MRELPYFKFYFSEWMTGKIVYESLEVQGLFINICALYWKNSGVLEISEIEQRYKKKNILAKLNGRFFSLNDGFIAIGFLDEQLSEREEVSKKNSLNGLKGGRPAIEKNKHKKSNIEREEERGKVLAAKAVGRRNVFSDCFTNWFFKQNEINFTMKVKDFVAMSEIEKYCAMNKKEGTEAIEMFRYVLENYNKLPDFYQTNKNPSFINSKFPEIIAIMRQKTINKKMDKFSMVQENTAEALEFLRKNRS